MEISERFSLLCAAWENAYILLNLKAYEADKIMNLTVCHTLEFMLMVNLYLFCDNWGIRILM